MTLPSWVASDLDGTLLDARYAWESARPALEALRAHGIPLVLCSSKTRAEMEALAAELPAAGALIVENGGAVVDDGRVRVLGIPREQLVEALASLAAETGATVRGFASLSPDELMELSGLDRDGAGRALQREYDEPFLATPDDTAALAAAAARRGLRVTRGGRFLHLTGPADKGTALAAWLAARGFERAEGLGLGDAPNDIPLLRAVGRPLLMPGPAGRVDPELRGAFPEAERAPGPGPVGWNSAVLAVLGGERLPQG